MTFDTFNDLELLGLDHFPVRDRIRLISMTGPVNKVLKIMQAHFSFNGKALSGEQRSDPFKRTVCTTAHLGIHDRCQGFLTTFLPGRIHA